LDYFNGKIRISELVSKIIDYVEKWKPLRVNVESVLFQEMIADVLAEKMEGKNLWIPISKIKVGNKSKEDRIKESLTAIVDWGKLYIREDMKEFEEQLVLFPNAKHDDLIDGLWLANYKAYTPPGHLKRPDKNKNGADNFWKDLLRQKNHILNHEKAWMIY